MANRNSKRVMDQRKANFDQISFLFETGGRKLIRTLALREGCSGSEVIRRSILARAGLQLLPYPQDLDALDAVQNNEDAGAALRRMQNREAASEVIAHIKEALGAEPAKARYSVTITPTDVHDLVTAVQRIESAIKENPDTTPVTVTLSGMEIGSLRRMLANIEQDQTT